MEAVTRIVHVPGTALSTTTCSTVLRRSRAASGTGLPPGMAERVAGAKGLAGSRTQGVCWVPSGAMSRRSRSLCSIPVASDGAALAVHGGSSHTRVTLRRSMAPIVTL